MTATVRLVGLSQRTYAKRLIDAAPLGHVVQIKEPTRNLEQNAKMHAMVEDIVAADPLGHGYELDDYKTVLMHAFRGELRLLHGIGGALIPAGRETRKLTVGQMRDFIEFIGAYGAQNGVRWSDDAKEAA